jgi:hypothetical protein
MRGGRPDPTKRRSNERLNMKTTRIEWQEQRQGEWGGWELFDVIAETDKTDKTGWAFYEKTTWDLAWIQIPATPCRVAKALNGAARLKSRLGHAFRCLSRSSGFQRTRWPACSVSGNRLKRNGRTSPQKVPYVPPVHLDRRLGHASPAERMRRVAGAGDLGNLEITPTEEATLPPSRSRRDSPRRLLIARRLSLR